MRVCECVKMRWIPDIITDGGRWPLPDHHPDCHEHKKERFINVICDGVVCTMKPDDAIDYINDSDEEYVTEEVFITTDQFNRLPEFIGF